MDNQVLAFLRRATLILNVVSVLLLLLVEAYVLLDLRSFEYPYLWRLLGAKGIMFLGALQAGLLLIAWRVHRLLTDRSGMHIPRLELLFHIVTIALLAWLLEWVFLETPATRLVADRMTMVEDRERVVQLATRVQRETPDFARMFPNLGDSDAKRLAVFLERSKLYAPEVFAQQALTETVAKYAARYDANAALLLSYLYHNSFDGEAVSGPMPFFDGLNGESFRDLVQAHTPWWFVESSARISLINNDYLERAFGTPFGWKLRYALQKATYDVSCGPYNTNVYTDLFLVLRQYKDQFPELFSEEADLLERALGHSFSILEERALLHPYDNPYAPEPMDSAYYSTYRETLITFSRAAYYKLRFDFDFATKAEALLVRYYYERFARAFGEDVWQRVSEAQRLSLIVMMHDMYTPNVGRLGYNLYMGPELILAAFPFVVNEAQAEIEKFTDHSTLWRPRNYEYLWGAATKKLRIFAEMWQVTTGESLQGFPQEDTFERAVDVLVHYR